MSTKPILVFGLAIATATLALAAGCAGDDDNKEPTQVFTGGSGGSGGTQSGGSGGISGDSSTGGSAGTPAGGSGGTAGDAGPDAPTEAGCPQDPSGCWPCPTTTEQFLNQCTTSQCSKFDNVARLPLYNNGNLPPIP